MWIISIYIGSTLNLCHKWPRVCSTCRKHFPVLSHLKRITGFVTRVTRRVLLVKQELPTLQEHIDHPRLKWGSCCSIFSFHKVYCSSLRDLFLLVIVLSVLPRFMVSDYPFGIFKLFLGLRIRWHCKKSEYKLQART